MTAPAYKVEVAFNAGWSTDSASRTWTDISAYVLKVEGLDVTVGRRDERSTADPNQLTLTLDNRDGRFTPMKSSGAYYPDVKIGRPIRVTATPSGQPDSVRFLGFVDEWGVGWPTAAATFATTSVVASSRMAWIAGNSPLRSLLSHAILAESPLCYWPLGEQGDLVTYADSIGSNHTRLRKSGGTVTFGDEHGPLTDDSTAALFENGAGHLELDGSLVTGSTFTVEGVICVTEGIPTPTVIRMTVPGPGNFLDLSIVYDTMGVAPAVATLTFQGDTGSAGVDTDVLPGVSDTEPHHWAIKVSGTSALLYWDGVSTHGATAGAAYSASAASSIRIGDVAATGKVAFSHIAIHQSALATSPTIVDHASATLDGFPSETTDLRLARYADMAGIPAGDTDFAVGQVGAIRHIDTSDLGALDAMRRVETTEGGVLFDAADGTLTFHGRAHRYAATAAASWAAGTGSSAVIQANFEPVLDKSALVNRADVTAGAGSTVTTVDDTTSQDAYGLAAVSLSLDTDNADEGAVRAGWIVGTYSEPALRAPTLTVEIAGMTAANQATALGITVGDKITATSLPTQHEATSASYFVEGYSESIRPGSHQLTFNVSPASVFDVWILDDATYSVLGSTTQPAY